MTLRLSEKLLKRIERHAIDSFPEECCGFLIGIRAEESEVLEVVPSKNLVREMRERRYKVDPLEFLRIEKGLLGSGREILGFYHSHPNSPARPSQYDLDHAWPVYSYLIISVSGEKIREVGSWTLSPDRKVFLLQEVRGVPD